MYKSIMDYYLNSEEYAKIEKDTSYKKLIGLLSTYLDEDVFLEAEELLNSEIAAKIEASFEAGFKFSLEKLLKAE